MLWKLLKYDFRAMVKSFAILWPASLVVALVNRFTIPFDRQQLADYLNVERSALSNELSKMCREGLISTNRSQFQLLSHGGLER